METTTPATWSDPETLRNAWIGLRNSGKIRNRDAADQLGVAEAELIASDCGLGVCAVCIGLRHALVRSSL